MLTLTLQSASLQCQSNSSVWTSDNGDGTYKNPIIYADYSDPDVIRVGENYYMVSSSFNSVPGLPILQSFDLINWTIIGHAIVSLCPKEIYDNPQPGNGVWAPSIRFHNNEFYIYYGDPDFGIFMVKSKEIVGPWSEPLLIKHAKGWEDPCPFWDDDGNAYLVHAWVGSRAGVKSILSLNKMNVEGTAILDEGVMIYDGHKNNPTVEGPKIYKRNGYYYIFAPAGGVKTGWQLVLRSTNIYGPYEAKNVLHQGNTNINGPHQGAWVETQTGESWFFHFQDLGPYGRVVNLQPMQWLNDWPLVGINYDINGTGEPVESFKKPNIGKSFPMNEPQNTDEFNSPQIGLQWQWNANRQAEWGFPTGNLGFFRLNALYTSDSIKNLWEVPNLMLQKFTAPEFSSVCKIKFEPHYNSDKCGLIVIGTDYSYIGVKYENNRFIISQSQCLNADNRKHEIINDSNFINNGNIYLKVQVTLNAICSFSYSVDSISYKNIGKSFQAKPGKWIGAKVGLFCLGETHTNDVGCVDIDWFRIEK
jgi:beta-xylosidase